MKKRVVRTLLFIMGIVILINVIQFIRPWARSNARIRSSVLKLIPIGTSWEEAIDIIREQTDWQLEHAPDLLPRPASLNPFTDGSTAYPLKFNLKGYGHPLYYRRFKVIVSLRFDENLTLREVEVLQFMLI